MAKDIKENYKHEEIFCDINEFEDLNLKDDLLRGIYNYGFEKPSPIQARAIGPMINGRDMVAQAQSGTGKTGTFVIGTLNIIDENIKGMQGLILAPTRELAQQIFSVTKSLSLYMKKLEVLLCVGGTDIKEDVTGVKNGSHLVIGTPGRIKNLITSKTLSTRLLRVLVLDEADELISPSFTPQIKEIIENVPSKTQICLYSATMPKFKLEISNNFMNNPLNILVKKDQLTLEGISQFYIAVGEEGWKFDTLCDLYDTITISQSIIYVNTKKKAEWIRDSMKEKGFPIAMINSDMTGAERSAIMENFRNSKTRILVATDLIARGIDIQQVSIVLNYDIPKDKECYIHRIGRSGRFGRKGVAINFVTSKEERAMHDLERFYDTQIIEMPENIGDYLKL